MASRLTVVLAGLVLVAAAVAGGADEAAAKKPLGTWERKIDNHTLQMQLKGDVLVFKISEGGNSVEVESNYGVTKTGTLFGIVNKVKLVGITEGPTEGHLFSFQFSVDKDTLTLKDLKGTDNAEARQLVEGEYKKVN